MKIPANDVTVVDPIFLGWNAPIRLWVFENYLATDSSQGVYLGMELTLKLWEFCPEIIYIYILEPSKHIHTIYNQLEWINTPNGIIETLCHNS